MATNENIVLQVDVQYNDRRLVELRGELASNKEQVAQLNAAFKAGQINLQDYNAGQVRLTADARNLQQEQRALIKTTEQQKVANMAATGSITQLRAQLALSTKAYNDLSAEERDNTEAGQKLQAQTKAISDQLKVLEAAVGDNRRNVGNYSGSLQTLVADLVKLQVQQKSLTEGSQEYAANQQAQIGFQTAAAQAAAKAGLSYEQAQASIKQYAAAIQPAVENLVKLEREQEELVESGQQATEAFRKIGFQIQATNKDIAETPVVAKSAEEALGQVDEVTQLFGGNVGSLRERFAQAKQGIELAKGGFTGLKGAIASTGIGVLILALGALFEYFTQTDDGAEELAAGMAGLKAIFSVVEAVVIRVGKGLVDFVKDPVQGIKDLGGLIKENIENRLNSALVIFDALKNGDLSKLGDGIIQAATGITNATAKTEAFTAELVRAGKVAIELAKAENKLEDDQRDSLVTLERKKNTIDQLVLSAKDRSLSEAQRLANLDKASKLETESLNITIRLANEKLRIVQATNAEAERTGKLSDEQRQAAAEAEAETIRLAGQSASLQQSIANRRSVLLQQEAAEAKEAREKAAAADQKRREDAVRALQTQLELQLLAVQRGSEEELEIRRKQIDAAAKLELANTKKTAAERALILAKAEREKQDVTNEFYKKEADAEKKRAEDRKTETEREFKESLKLLESYLEDKRNQAQIDQLNGLTTEEEYQEQLSRITKAGLDAEAVIYADYGQETTELSKKVTDAQIKDLTRLRTQKNKDDEKEKKRLEELYDTTAELTDGIGQAFGQLFSDQTKGFEEFGKTFILLILDTLQKIVLAQQAAAVTQSLAQPDSVATFGASGAVRAGILTGLITAAFETAKSVITAGFAEGGAVSGPGTGTSDSVVAYGPGDRSAPTYRLSAGEHVLTATEVRNMGGHAAVEILRAQYRAPGAEGILGWLSRPSYSPQTRYAIGGPVGVGASVFDGGFAQRAVSDTGGGIDYNRLAEAMSKYQVITRIKDINDAQTRREKPRALTSISTKR